VRAVLAWSANDHQIEVMTDPTYRRTRDLLEAELGYDIVALDALKGRTFGFNESAAWAWKLLENPQTIISLTSAMLERFDHVDESTCEADLREILREFEACGLVERAPGESSVPREHNAD
jgi:hypothetical protein